MSKHRNLRTISDYLAATRNEIYADELSMRISGIKPTQAGFFPRVPRWIGFGLRFPLATRLAYLFARFFWTAGIAHVLFLFEYVRFTWLKNRKPRPPNSAILLDGAVIALSSRTSEVLSAHEFDGLPKSWLTVPWARQRSIPEGAQEITLLSLATNSDLANSFFNAMIATYAIQRRKHMKDWILQTYTAFRWFLVRAVIDKVSGPLVTTSHFDRWAVLLDRSIRGTPTTDTNSITNRELILVQHGTLGEIAGQTLATERNSHVPTRLVNARKLYAYNATEEKFFHSKILSIRDKTAFSVSYFRPTLLLTVERAKSKPCLLFASHPLCEKFQIELLISLSKELDFYAYIKPHPRAASNKFCIGENWEIIKDTTRFPRVDLLVSYPSTLVVEYENCGISAVVHPIDASPDRVSDFILRIKKELNSALSKDHANNT